MAVKLVVVVLTVLTIASASLEREKRQSGVPDFSEYFNKFQEQMKPIAGQLPSFPKPPSGFPSFPNGGSSGSQYKRDVSESPSPYITQEFLSQFLGGNGFSNLPFKPPQFGQFPGFPGSPSSPSGEQENTDN